MVRSLLLVFAAGSVFACVPGGEDHRGDADLPDGGPSDSGRADSGLSDSGRADSGVVTPDSGVRADAAPLECPPASSYVGDPSWPSMLTASAASTFCAYPAQDVAARDVLSKKLTLHLVEGVYPLPLVANDAPFFLPACFGTIASPPSIGEGEVVADRSQDFDDPAERYRLRALFPLSDGTYLQLNMKRPLDAPDVDLSEPVAGFSTAQALRCADPDCVGLEDELLIPCNMKPRLCDRFVFEDGRLAIEQFHWAGQVGAGFASPLRVRGDFRGEDVDIDSYTQMTMGYGHHAFTRELILFFDAPIDGVCGLHFPEVSEYGIESDVVLLDCAANAIGTSSVSVREHLFNGGCPR